MSTPLPMLLKQMDRVDTFRQGDGFIEPPVSTALLDPAVEQLLPNLQHLYQEQEGVSLSTGWLRSALSALNPAPLFSKIARGKEQDEKDQPRRA